MRHRRRVHRGAKGQHQGVPAMWRGTGRTKRRGRGEGMGAENGDTWAETVRTGAGNRGGGSRPSGGGGDGGQGVRVLSTCLLPPVFYCGGMRPSILLNTWVIHAGVAVVGWPLTPPAVDPAPRLPR